MTWREPAEKRAHHASFGSESILWYSKCKAILVDYRTGSGVAIISSI
jgi:hypothetical protein